MDRDTRGRKPGWSLAGHFFLRDRRLYIPPDRHFCLCALHAALPLPPAKQRHVEDWDWMAEDHTIICPDPAGNVIRRIGFDDAPR